MSDQLELLKLVASRLDAAGVGYMIWTKDSPSELQLRDVRSIIASQPALDWAYVDRWAVRLTVAKLLKEVR